MNYITIVSGAIHILRKKTIKCNIVIQYLKSHKPHYDLPEERKANFH